jgi:hypothetical protein
MSKLMQLPHKVSPDNDLFLSMVLIRLPPSMRETIGAGNHKKMAAAMVKDIDALSDARAAKTSCSKGKRVKRGAAAPNQKVILLPHLPFPI